jgi:hypothetical protein
MEPSGVVRRKSSVSVCLRRSMVVCRVRRVWRGERSVSFEAVTVWVRSALCDIGLSLIKAC